MIPAFNHSHVLPPFLGESPGALSELSPYVVSMLALTEQFAHLPGRTRLVQGLLDYRAAWRRWVLCGAFSGLTVALWKMWRHISSAHPTISIS